MKKLTEITEDQAIYVARLLSEPFISFITNDGHWDYLGLEVSIQTTSTINNHTDDSTINIYKDGKITLWRNNGNWGGARYENINTLPVIDYLRSEGFEFNY